MTKQALQHKSVSQLRKLFRLETDIKGYKVLQLNKEQLIDLIHKYTNGLIGTVELHCIVNNNNELKGYSNKSVKANTSVSSKSESNKEVKESNKEVKESNKEVKESNKEVKETKKESETMSIDSIIKGQINEVVGSRISKLEAQLANSGVNKPIVITINDVSVDMEKQLFHNTFQDVLKCATMRLDVMLVGAAGSGKTTLVSQIGQALKLKHYAVSVGLQTTKSDLFGFVDANGNYHTTAFREAYQNGGVFLLDEVDAGNPNTMTNLNMALDNGYCFFPDCKVERHKDFILIAAGNTYGKGADRVYCGRNQMDGAFIERVVMIDFDYDEELESKLTSNKQWFERVKSIRKSVYKLKERIVVSPRATFKGELLLANGFSQDKVESMVIFKGASQAIKDKVLANI